jgi:hypothetical protein
MMLCDACLMLLYQRLKATITARDVLFALTIDDFPTIEAIGQESGLTSHQVRDALNLLRGTGLVWGDGCHGLSESGYRLLELLRSEGQPEPAETLCDACLLEIGQELHRDAFAVLAQLADRITHGRHDLMLSTELTTGQMRVALRALEGAGLIKSARGRSFRLSETGRRLERLLKSQIPNLQYPIPNIQSPISILHSESGR